MLRRAGHSVCSAASTLSRTKPNLDTLHGVGRTTRATTTWARCRRRHSWGVADKRLIFGVFGVLASSFDWAKERISDADVLKYSAEMSLVAFLKDKKEACLSKAGSAECECTVCSSTDSEWQSYIDKDDITVWRRESEHHRGQGLYCYKMYASYHDVTAIDFLEAQVDLDYRLQWDKHAVKLELLDSEPATNSDLIYWETKWPSMFSNRDYVFLRRYRVDHQRKLLFLVNRSAEHPAKPPTSKKQRVSEYWSYMVIKPRTSFDQPGMEFSLTYFDNPGANVPSYMMNWVTTSAMPEFLVRLREAAQGMARRRGGPSKLRNTAASEGLLQTLWLT